MQRAPKLKIINKKGKEHIFDPIRKKYVVLTPEEEVRQLFLYYMIHEKGYPPGLIAVETTHKYLQQRLRTDILVFDRRGQPKLIVECKAPEVELTQKVLDQVARYNLNFKVDHLVVTNGNTCYTCHLDHETKTFEVLEEIPMYESL